MHLFMTSGRAPVGGQHRGQNGEMILARNFYASKFPQLSRQKTPSRRRTLSCGDALRGLMPREKMMKKKNNLQVYELYAIIVFKWESFSQPISLSPHLFTIKGLLHGNDDFAGNTCAWKLMLYHPIGELFPALHLSSFLPCQSIFPVISPTLCQSGTPPSVCSSLHTSFSEMMILVSFFGPFKHVIFPYQTLYVHLTARSPSTFDHWSGH